MNSFLPWLALLLPLASAFIIMIATRPARAASGFISVAAVLGSFVCSCLIFFQQTSAAPAISWINLGAMFSVPLGLTLDPLSRSMLFMVTGVGALIHIYSLGYMGADAGKSRYFAGLSLFRPGVAGSRTVNLAPSPSWLSTAISPPCASTTILARYRPTPVPTIPETLLPL